MILHVVTLQTEANPDILMALVDLGLVDAADAGIIGYPSGYTEDKT